MRQTGAPPRGKPCGLRALRRVGFEQLDDGIGCIFVQAVLEKPCKKRTRRHVGNADKRPEEIIYAEFPVYIAALDCAPHQGANRFTR